MATLSAYEMKRLETIAQNEGVLKSMGLLDDAAALRGKKQVRKPAKKRKPEVDPDYVPEKRVTRVSARTKRANDDDDESNDDSDDEYVDDIPRPRPAPKARAAAAKVVQDRAGEAPDAEPSIMADATIVVENAKTGRSKCRRCLEMLSQGEVRVGAESWMVGRQVTVWQHPRCFLAGVSFTEETSGRGKCKQTREPFAAGEHKLSTTAHTTTSHYKLDAAASLLRPVVVAAHAETKDRRAAIACFEGVETLTPEERQSFEATLMDGGANASEELAMQPTPSTETVLEDRISSEATKSTAKEPSGSTAEQPAKGIISRATGRVCWRFGGSLCFGTLLPKQESKTHCYARTHKGNTKILTKGLTSWWLEPAV